MDRNKARLAVSYLENYRVNKQGIITLQRQLEKLALRSGPSELTATSYDNAGGGGGFCGDAILSIEKANKLANKIAEKRIEVQLVEDALNVINTGRYSDHYAEILIMRHVDGWAMADIADSLGYSSRQTVYDQYYKALNKFATAMEI